MKIIVVASAKGGVAKTTTAANVAAALGEQEATLLLDFDPQGQCSLWYGLDPRSGVHDYFVGAAPLANTTVAAPGIPHLWLLPGDSRTKAVEKIYRALTVPQFNELMARVLLLRDHFNTIVIDTAPSGVLQEIALAAADEIVVPFRCEVPGIDGAYGTLAMIERLAHQARITLLPVDFYAAVVEQRRSLADLREVVHDHRVADPVPHRIAVAEAVAEGKTIWAYTGRGIEPVREAYRALLALLAQPEPGVSPVDAGVDAGVEVGVAHA